MANLMDLFFRIGVDSSELDRALSSASQKASSFGSAFKSGVGTVLGVGAKAVGVATAAVGAFAGTSVKAGSDFDAAMSQVGATMLKTSEEMKAEVGEVDTAYGHFSGNLRDFAQFLGKETVFSATQAAEALNYMALAGYDTQESMDMLPNVLSLAAAGGFDLARASDMVTDAQSAFGISAERTAQMVDEMAKAASTGNTSVEQLGDAFLVVGGLAKELNGGFVELADGTKAPVDGITEMEIAMTAMANAGIKGSEAGTHMRNMIMKLSKPTSDGTVLLEKMGVKVFDTSGQMRSLADIMGDLNGALGTMTQEEKINAIGELFNTRDLASAEALLGAVGKDWNEIGESILNADGAAADMAALQLDNLQGDVKLFKSALEGAQIVVSDQLTPSLRKFVQFGTDGLSTMTDAFKEGGLSGAMSAFGKILSEGITMITGMLPDFINAGMDLLGALGQGIIDNLPQLVDAATQIVVQLANGLVQALPELAKGAITLIKSLKDSFAQNSGVLLEVGSELLSMLWQGVTEGLPMLTQGALELMSNLATYLQDAIPQLLPVALNALMEFSGSLRENAGLLVDGALDLIMALADGLIANLPVMIETIPTIVSNIAGIINDNAPKLIATGIELIGSLVAGIIDAIPTLIAEFPKIVQAIFDVITAVNWISLGNTIINGIKNGVTNLAAQIPQKLSEIGQKAFNALKNVDWRNLGSTIINFIVNGIRGLITQIPNVLKSIGHNALSAMRNIDWLGLGRNIIAGIASGITGAAGRIVDAAKSAAKKALNAAKNFLGIHSPSRVFREQVGKNIDLGLAGGIDAYADEVEEAANDLAESVTNPFETFDETARYISPASGANSILGGSGGLQNTSGEPVVNILSEILDRLREMDISGMGVYMDGRALVGELVPAMDAAFGREANYKGRGIK